MGTLEDTNGMIVGGGGRRSFVVIVIDILSAVAAAAATTVGVVHQHGYLAVRVGVGESAAELRGSIAHDHTQPRVVLQTELLEKYGHLLSVRCAERV